MIAIFLLFAALTISLTSLIGIGSDEIMLSTQTLSKEVWVYEGSLQWLQKTFTGTILQTTSFLITSGIATLLISLKLKFLQAKQENPALSLVKKVISITNEAMQK